MAGAGVVLLEVLSFPRLVRLVGLPVDGVVEGLRVRVAPPLLLPVWILVSRPVVFVLSRFRAALRRFLRPRTMSLLLLRRRLLSSATRVPHRLALSDGSRRRNVITFHTHGLVTSPFYVGTLADPTLRPTT